MRNILIFSLLLLVFAGCCCKELRNRIEPEDVLLPELGLKMVPVPPGLYERKDEHDLGINTQVLLGDNYWISEAEITESQYVKLTGEFKDALGEGSLPIRNVSWRDAMRFCEILNRKYKKGLELPDDYSFRLPTQSEWEYACRAGSKKDFCFGDDESQFDNYGWCYTNSGDVANPVKSKLPNVWGVYDMHGNVSEMCIDGMVEITSQTLIQNPFNGGIGDRNKAVCGGNYELDPIGCTSDAYYYICSLEERSPHVGFRIVFAKKF